MITEKDLQEAIAECQGVRNPNANTAIKLAAFLTIQREMFGKPETMLPSPDAYSYAASPVSNDTVRYEGDTEFSEVIGGKDVDKVIPVIDELMTVLQATYPRLYDAVIAKLDEL